MKKILLFAVVLTGAMAFTSCGSEECKCDGGSITEDDVDGTGVTLEEACNLAKIGDSSCEMK